MNSEATIFIGCGGSGNVTLRRLNTLIAEDAVWRERADTDIYYMLFDTDENELAGFEDAIRTDMRGASSPYVKSVALSRDVSTLQPHVQKYFSNPDTSPAGRERLEEHWWVNTEGKPFIAERVRNTVKGAGQCPPVAYFLAWMNMRQIEEAFDELVKEITARRSNTGEPPMKNLNFVLVAGTAGGTGRGCWQTIAFKMREMFNKEGVNASPAAFLFDSSVCASVCASHPTQRRQMRANSLTGFSETSCWVTNKDSAKLKYSFRLPDMLEPGVSSQDVLSVDLAWDVANAAPVDSAFLIFDRNAVASLASLEDYYSMVGTALYTRITESEIERRQINAYHAYRSVGAASFEVPSTRLRKYFEGLVRLKSARSLQEQHARAVHARIDRVMEEGHMALGVTQKNRTNYKKDPKGSLLQRILHRISASKQASIDALAAALREKENTVEDIGGYLPACLDANVSVVTEAVGEVIAEMDASPVALAKKTAQALFNETGSVLAVRDFASGLVRRLESEYSDLPSTDVMRLPDEKQSLRVVEERAGKEYLGIFGPRFNEAETNDILGNVKMEMLYSHYPAVQESLTGQYKSWIQEIAAWAASADALLSRLGRIETRFEKTLLEDIRIESLSAASGKLFTDPSRPDLALPAKASESRFYRRELRPVVAPGEEERFLPEVALDPNTEQLIAEQIFDKGFSDCTESEKDRLTDAIQEELVATAILTEDFVEDFSIARVVEDLRDAWQAYLNRIKGDRDEYGEACDKFMAYFGVRPERSAADDIVLPDARTLLLKMAMSLAGTCKPFWRLKEGAETSLAVTIFLPPASGDDSISPDEKKTIGAGLPTGPPPNVVAARNPFILLVHAMEGTTDLGQVKSLDYWKEDSTLLALLESAESSKGTSIFDITRSNGGAGFVSPIYVRNEQLREHRWKPWATARGVDSRDEERATEALCYALLEPDEAVGEKLAIAGWSLPLIENSGQQNYRFTRREIHWDEHSPSAVGGEVREQIGGCWEPKDRLAVRVNQIEKLFQGEPVTTGPDDQEQCAEWTTRVLEEAREFWDDVATHFGFNKGSALYRSFWEAQAARFDESRRNGDAEDIPTWERLVAYAQAQLS